MQVPPREVAVALRAIAGLLVLSIVAILSFHPWVLSAVSQIVDVLPLMVLVLIFVYVMRPTVGFFHRLFRRLPRMEHISTEKSLGLTYLILLGLIIISLAWLLPRLVDEVRTLAQQLPAYTQKLRDSLMEYRAHFGTLLPPALQDQISEATGEVGRMLAQLMQRGVGYVGAVSQAVLFVLSAVFLVPLLGFYFLKDHDGLLEFNLRLLPPATRHRVRLVLVDMHMAMQNFIKGQVILCLVIGVVTTLAMLMFLPEYAIGLGIVAGITEAIPVVGPLIGAVPAIIIAFAAKGPGIAVGVIVAYIAIQQMENVVLVPRIMGGSLGLHPLSLLLGMTIFGNLFGFWGVLLASPLVAAVKILVVHLLLHEPATAETQAIVSAMEHEEAPASPSSEGQETRALDSDASPSSEKDEAHGVQADGAPAAEKREAPAGDDGAQAGQTQARPQ